MKKDDILVLKANPFIRPEELEEMRQKILQEREDGVIMLPPTLTVISCSQDTKILLKDK